MLNSMAVGQRPGFRGLKIRRSAQSAVHGGDEAGRWPAIEPNCSPRALPWAGMKQAVGLDAADSIRPPQWVQWKMWVMTSPRGQPQPCVLPAANVGPPADSRPPGPCLNAAKDGRQMGGTWVHLDIAPERRALALRDPADSIAQSQSSALRWQYQDAPEAL